MAGNIEPAPPHPAVLERGHILEPAVAAWVQAHHPEWRVRDCGGRWWQVAGHCAATPDRILVDAETRDVVGLLEIKTSSHSDGWGTPGTDEIPPPPTTVTKCNGSSIVRAWITRSWPSSRPA